ncbi:MAG: SIS domain-containing protein [Chloroflexi bacterium]|nr:MAG: SIS domain-containing protein [Chloroflexota bacterium]
MPLSPASVRYAKAALDNVERILETQLEVIAEAGRVSAGAILRDGLVHLFGSGHSRMAVEEMYPRYGSFPGFHPIVELSLSNHHQVVGSNGQRQAMFIENAEGLGRVILDNFRFDSGRDVMLVVSSGGTNAVPVEVALEARSRGLPVIAITSVEHSRRSFPTHSSGTRLFEVADLVVDACTPVGDAAVSIPGLDTPVAPLSSVVSLTIINMLKADVAQRLTEAGKPTPVITSPVLVGDERSRQLFEDNYREYRERTRRL